MDAQWCKGTLEEAIDMHGKPEILNTDQGSQFTSEIFTHSVLSKNIKFSMDGKGRAIDNVFIERLWRSVKYESVYLNPPESGIDLYRQLNIYFDFYNHRRRHQGIENENTLTDIKTRKKSCIINENSDLLPIPWTL